MQTQTKIANANAGVPLSVSMSPDADGAHKVGASQLRRPARAGDQLAHFGFCPNASAKKGHAHQFQVIRASDFVCFDADEHLNFEDTRKVLEQLAVACRKRGLDRAMVDLRDLPVPEKPRFTRGELAEMAEAFRAAGFTGRQRLAVLHSHDTHGTIREFVSICREHGLQVHAFGEFDAAIHWLGKPTETEHPVECKHGAEVPIVRKKKVKAANTTKQGAHQKREIVPGGTTGVLKRGRHPQG